MCLTRCLVVFRAQNSKFDRFGGLIRLYTFTVYDNRRAAFLLVSIFIQVKWKLASLTSQVITKLNIVADYLPLLQLQAKEPGERTGERKHFSFVSFACCLPSSWGGGGKRTWEQEWLLASDFNMAENETHEIRQYPGRKARSKLHQSHQKESSALLDI